MAATLTASDVRVSHGRVMVLDGVDLALAPGQRVGVVGPNGVGKSTLLGVLAGLVVPDRGVVVRSPRDATVGLLTQERERFEGETVRELLARRAGVAQADAELEAATAALAEGESGAGDRYSAALEHWLALGADDFDARAEAIWADLGLGPELLARPTTVLSGGEAARAALASALLARFDVLLLDEPTNDLDLDGLERLEAHVLARTEPLVVVSHDRAFLERVVTAVVEIDEHTRRASRFEGGWVAYGQEKAVARRHAEEAYAVNQATRGTLAARAQRERAWMTKGVAAAKRRPPDNDKAARKFHQEVTEQLAGRAARTERAIERLETVEKPWEGWDLRFAIAAAPRSGAIVAELHEAVVVRGEFRLGPVELTVGWGERLAIVGPNGSGKTTLLEALVGRIPLDEGRQRLGPGVVLGGIDQARATFEGSRPLVATFLAATGTTLAEGRAQMAKFGLGAAHVGRPARSLSPGERTRAAMALLAARGVNCLVLDEPTNHLDLPAIEQLEQALDGFDGTVLLVSHDRRLLANVHLGRTIRVDQGRIVADEAR